MEQTFDTPLSIQANAFIFYNFPIPSQESITVQFSSNCRLPLFFSQILGLQEIKFDSQGTFVSLNFDSLGQHVFQAISLESPLDINMILEPSFDAAPFLSGRINNVSSREVSGVVFCILPTDGPFDFQFDIIRSKDQKNLSVNMDPSWSEYNDVYTIDIDQTLVFWFQDLDVNSTLIITSDDIDNLVITLTDSVASDKVA